MSEETKAKISAALRGRPKSEAHRAAMSASQTGRTHTAETKAKIANAARGERSAESRARMSAAQQVAWSDPERRRRESVQKMGRRGRGEADGRYLDSDGYAFLTGQQGHPLAYKNGSIAEHRKILYDAIGPGQHPCEWCGKLKEWGHGLYVDHLDDDKTNNDLANLVPSCLRCNWGRSRRKTN